MTPSKTVRILSGLTAALLLSTVAAAPAHAFDQSRIHQPGTFEALMYSKLPGVYGPHLAVPEAKSERPGSFAAFQFYRKGQALSGPEAATGHECHAAAIDEFTKPKVFRARDAGCR